MFKKKEGLKKNNSKGLFSRKTKEGDDKTPALRKHAKKKLNPSAFSQVEGKLPRLVSDCVEWLLANHAEKVEGLFRISGDWELVKAIHEAYTKTRKRVDLKAANPTGSPHVIAGVLKMYLREIPVPLLTFEYYDSLLAASSESDERTQKFNIKTVLQLLPPGNKMLLDYLLKFLSIIAGNAAVNKMGADNLSIVFGPCFMRSQTNSLEAQLSEGDKAKVLTEMLILHYNYFFLEDESKEAKKQRLHGTLRGNNQFYQTLKKGTVRLATSIAEQERLLNLAEEAALAGGSGSGGDADADDDDFEDDDDDDDDDEADVPLAVGPPPPLPPYDPAAPPGAASHPAASHPAGPAGPAGTPGPQVRPQTARPKSIMNPEFFATPGHTPPRRDRRSATARPAMKPHHLDILRRQAATLRREGEEAEKDKKDDVEEEREAWVENLLAGDVRVFQLAFSEQ